MLIYKSRYDMLLDPFCRMMIPYDLGLIINDSNQDGHPPMTIYRTDTGVVLENNKISILFPTSMITGYIILDNGTYKVTTRKQISCHLNPFSNSQLNTRRDIIVQRREVPIGKFRISYFKGD